MELAPETHTHHTLSSKLVLSNFLQGQDPETLVCWCRHVSSDPTLIAIRSKFKVKAEDIQKLAAGRVNATWPPTGSPVRLKIPVEVTVDVQDWIWTQEGQENEGPNWLIDLPDGSASLGLNPDASKWRCSLPSSDMPTNLRSCFMSHPHLSSPRSPASLLI